MCNVLAFAYSRKNKSKTRVTSTLLTVQGASARSKELIYKIEEKDEIGIVAINKLR